jgi:hypothetical protein
LKLLEDGRLDHSRRLFSLHLQLLGSADDWRYTTAGRVIHRSNNYHQSPQLATHDGILHVRCLARACLDWRPQSRSPPHLVVDFLPQALDKSKDDDEKRGFASIGGSVRPMTRCKEPCASTEGSSRDPKMRLINVLFLRTISEIKLKRTDTTLDLSQKALRYCQQGPRQMLGGGRDLTRELKFFSRGSGPLSIQRWWGEWAQINLSGLSLIGRARLAQAGSRQGLGDLHLHAPARA